jgi:hypothetical protein
MVVILLFTNLASAIALSEVEEIMSTESELCCISSLEPVNAEFSIPFWPLLDMDVLLLWGMLPSDLTLFMNLLKNINFPDKFDKMYCIHFKNACPNLVLTHSNKNQHHIKGFSVQALAHSRILTVHCLTTHDTDRRH